MRKYVSMGALLRKGLIALGAVVALVFPSSALAGAVITPVPTFPFPSVTIGQAFPASITLFNNSTGAEAGAGVIITASNLDFYPACPAVFISDCPTADPTVFTLSATGTSGAGTCPAGIWTIVNTGPGRFRFNPPGPIQLAAFGNCTVNFSAEAHSLPSFDASPAVPGVQTDQVASVDAFSPITNLTVRNSGSGATSVEAPPTPAPTPTPQAGQGVGSAQLALSEGCTKKAKATVKGPDIQQVKFVVDGKTLLVDKSAPFQLSVPTQGLSKGRHHLTATVTFTAASAKPKTTLNGGFLRCRTRKVQFTG
jgi:hypothetical protein